MSIKYNEKTDISDPVNAELVQVKAELERTKAELAALKKRFGIDKQEEFLKTNANITIKEFAAMLFGQDC
jgi:hypothetical protein